MAFDAAYFAPSITWRWRAELVDAFSGDVALSLTDADGDVGITGGSLDWSIFRGVRESGALDLRMPARLARSFNWDQLRVRVGLDMLAPSEIPHQLAYCFPTVSAVTFSGGWASCSLDLHGRVTEVEQQRTTSSTGFAKGTLVSDALSSIMAPYSRVSVTPSTAVLSSDRSWEPGTTDLERANSIATTTGYFGLYSTPDGWLRLDPYTPPGARTPQHRFADDEFGLYTREWTLGEDTWDTPNRVTVIQRAGQDEVIPLVVVAMNDDPASPVSYTRRRRWIDAEPITIDAESPSALLAAGRRLLAEAESTTQTLDFHYGYLPLVEHDAVTFVNRAADVEAIYTLAKRSIQIGGPALVSAQIRRTR